MTNGGCVNISEACWTREDLANLLRIIFDNKNLTPETKMKAFRAYVEPIFLYNFEIWTIIPSQAIKAINAFQRRLLRT